MEEIIRRKIEEEFSPIYIELENESHRHSVPKGSATHFRLVLVSEKFNGLRRIDRSRLVNELMKPEFSNGLHAFSQRLLAPNEWTGSVEFKSPPCAGGEKK